MHRYIFLSSFLMGLLLIAGCGDPPNFSWPDRIPDIQPSKFIPPTPYDEWKEQRLKEEHPVLIAGEAMVDLTPENPQSVYIAGYMPNKKATGLGGPITGRILLLDDGRQTLVMIGLDFVGYMNDAVRKTRYRISRKYGSDILIASTHTHAGPDTIGMWGSWAFFAMPLSSGRNPAYMDMVERRLARGVFEAIRRARPVKLFASEIDIPPGISYNSHKSTLKDDRMTILQARDQKGLAVATVVNYACHAEFLGQNNTRLAPDFPGYLYRELEKLEGGLALFFNGAIGGIVVPAMPRRTERYVRLREKGAQRAGKILASYASYALDAAEELNIESIEIRRTRLKLPIENDVFVYLANKKIISRSLRDERLWSEVWAVDLGGLSLLTVPGEIFPSLGFKYKDIMTSRYKMIVGLGNDELGYIMDSEEWNDPLYTYERTVSPGKSAGGILTEAVRSLYPPPDETK